MTSLTARGEIELAIRQPKPRSISWNNMHPGDMVFDTPGTFHLRIRPDGVPGRSALVYDLKGQLLPSDYAVSLLPDLPVEIGPLPELLRLLETALTEVKLLRDMVDDLRQESTAYQEGLKDGIEASWRGSVLLRCKVCGRRYRPDCPHCKGCGLVNSHRDCDCCGCGVTTAD